MEVKKSGLGLPVLDGPGQQKSDQETLPVVS